MTPLRKTRRGPPAAIIAAATALCLATAIAAAQDSAVDEVAPPAIRRVFVPVGREQHWPAGDWQPVALGELERQLAAARAATRERPAAFLERADYTATLVGSELRDARLEWTVRQPDAALSALSLGRFNLNVSRLEWVSDRSAERPVPALWGTDPRGTPALVVDRRQGEVAGDWSLAGRRLAASTEFDVALPPAAISRLTLRIPTGLVLTSSSGDLSEPAPAPQPGWNEWRLNLGGQSACRLRVATPPDAKASRALILVRNSVSYFVRTEAVRLRAEFDIEVLESRVRELRLSVDPDVQVTSVEFGDDGAVVWKTSPAPSGQEVVVQLPDAIAGEGHSLAVQGISQVKQFAPWTLPRIRLQNAVEAAGRATLFLESPALAADIRTEGYRQIELTADADEEEILVFRQLAGDGTITIVPTDGKPDITCRAFTLIQPDLQQWSMTAQWEWTATRGSAYATACQVSELWDVVDVRSVSGDGAGDLSGWEVQEAAPGRRVLHLYYLNALNPDRPQRVRISARRAPPGAGQRAAIPPLVALDASTVEQFVVASTSSEFRAVVEDGKGIELLAPGDLPPPARALDFLSTRLADRGLRSIVFRSQDSSAAAMLRVEPVEPQRDSAGTTAKPAGEPGTVAAPSAIGGPSPVALEVAARLTGLASGFDHYLAKFRMARPSGDVPFDWSLPQSAELLGVEVDGRRVLPFVRGTRYSVTAVPVARVGGEPAPEVMTVAVEYRVPSLLHFGPNVRPLIFPECDESVQQSDLVLRLPAGVRLESSPAGLVMAGVSEPLPWYQRLAGPLFRPADEPRFNPLRQHTWPVLFGGGGAIRDEPPPEREWRVSAPAAPVAVRIVIWNAAEVQWLAWALLLAALVAGIIARLVQFPSRRGLSIIAPAGLCLATLVLPPVVAELAGSAFAGALLSLLFPRRFLVPAQGPAPDQTDDVPVGSTQSFVAATGLCLALAATGIALSAHAQEPSAPAPIARPAVTKPSRAVVDVLVPVGSDGRPAGEAPVAYVPTGLMARLALLSRSAKLPAYLIAGSKFDATVEETNRLRIAVRIDVHVFAGEATVPVPLALGSVNLGGADACLVDGRPHSVTAGPDGRGLVIELPGAEPVPSVPAVPQQESTAESNGGDADDNPVEPPAPPLPVRTCTIELHLFPAVDAARGDLFSSTVAIPPGCQIQATMSSPVALAIAGITADAGPPTLSDHSPAPGKVVYRPGPTKQLVFYWSAGKAGPPPAEEPKSATTTAADADLQAGVSCLADVSAALVQMRYHIAYRVQSGRVASLVWHVPAGYVLESVQAPQLAGYRFDPAGDGGRRMLIEFSRPQTGDFSLAATFAVPLGGGDKQLSLPLLDPLRDEQGQVRQIGLRFHQMAVRHPSDLRVNVAPPVPESAALKPRPVDDFLKEWNAAGARPQLAFDLERSFAVNLTVENPPVVPAVRSSSIARFHPGRLDWTFLAEVAQPAIPPFLYRLHVDPRLRIRSVSVLEDGAERRLRWSQMRETAVVFLNDRATRGQTVRIDATLALSSSQEVELPRIRFVGATPGPERVTLYHAADVSIELANPEDFPLSPVSEGGNSPAGDVLTARLDVLPEQAQPRVRVEPVVPKVSARTATVLELRDGTWRWTSIVTFAVASGRVTAFPVELPEGLAAIAELRSIPPARVSRQPADGGRVRVTFHPDEPVERDFTAILSGMVRFPEPAWQPPVPRFPEAAPTAAWLVFPHAAFELPAGPAVAESAAVPDWVREVVPATLVGGAWDCVRLSAPDSLPLLRAARHDSAKSFAGSAQIELWLEPDGARAGRLALNIAGPLPAVVELAWPTSARPTALYAGGVFRPLPVPADGICTVHLPPGTTDPLVWLAWTDPGAALPLLSGPVSGQVPWPRQIPVENCRVTVHPPAHFRAQAQAPVGSAAPNAQAPPVPVVLAAAAETATPLPGDEFSLVVAPAPPPGTAFELGAALRFTNGRPAQVGLALLAALAVALTWWKGFPVWSWFVRHETICWLGLAALWWLCLAPSWLGPAIAVWAGVKAFRRRTAPLHDFASASTAHAPPPLSGAGF